MTLSGPMDTPMGNTPNSGPGMALGGAAGIQQPKVQTAFIHKLYNMLEDANIQHLISWSPSNDSFVVQPTGEFSKVLSQYFKHTNISSFVRQLNMYGFHKVNDVFHTGSPDSTLWEFKHGNGSFKRGDLVGLRDIKRRASRHALIHRDSFPGSKSAGPSVPGTPNEQMGDSIENRMSVFEHTINDIAFRLSRTEEANAMLSNRCQTAIEGLTRCHQVSPGSKAFSILSFFMPFLSSLPYVTCLAFFCLNSMQKEIERHTQLLEEPQDLMLRDRQPMFASSLGMDNSAPLSPRQRPLDDESRRSSITGPLRPGGYFRTPAPPHIPNPPRRFASGALAGSSSPNSLRPQQPPQPPQQHPLANFQSPPSHLSRRHTSADIRLQGWQANSPFSGLPQSGGPGHQWPPSPNRHPHPQHDNTREILANYEIQQHRPPIFSSQTTPPLSETTSTNGVQDSGWNFSGPPKFNPREAAHTAPPTRRSSLASSSVHALLNPTDNSSGDNDRDRREGMSDGEPEDRNKRKRIQ
ncbi:hypothetical protein P167DRAFT_479980 [Morchella conica CCBAS932]|uniref:HSF-type DNA-binding domain-containing protein n=1 Tax=Morchella conica CCBAS932 TaxID=1392247 RepID=A0A3N4L253_9PEZI|nr:hypothetical protein P167DRAFT_479980 [Morchella conica CCBAS932]